jgi:hypothetical protein
MRNRTLVSACICSALIGACGSSDGSSPNSNSPNSDAGAAQSVVQVTPCDATTPCSDPVANYCFISTNGSGYCAKTGCTTSKDCTAGFFCDLTLAPSVCKRPPTGEGTPCASAQDCAQFEANYCESAVSKTCLVSPCSPSLNNCDDTHICCDFSFMNLPTICVNKAAIGGACIATTN